MSFVRLSLLFLFVLVAGQSFGQSSSELKRRKEALNREIEMLRRSQSKIASNKKLSLKQINVLSAQIRLRQEKINTINSEIHLLDNQIYENTNTVKSLQSQLSNLKKEYAAMVLFAFRNQSAYSKLMFIFAASDFNQAYKRLKYLQQFGEYRQKQARYIEQTQHSLGVKIVELDHNKREKTGLLNDQEKEKNTLGQEKNVQSTQLSRLSKEEKQLRRQVAQKQSEMSRLNRAMLAAINRELEEERRRVAAERAAAERRAAEANRATPGKTAPARSSSVLAATPEAAKLSSDFLSNRGRLPWPVSEGTIVEHYGTHGYGVNVTVENNGVDIKTAPGANVRAVFSGEVRSVNNIGGQYAVLIRHGEYFTVYSNLRSVSVSKGQKVSIKQSIGSVITDPVDGTTQLHFEIRKLADPQNPETWLAN